MFGMNDPTKPVTLESLMEMLAAQGQPAAPTQQPGAQPQGQSLYGALFPKPQAETQPAPATGAQPVPEPTPGQPAPGSVRGIFSGAGPRPNSLAGLFGSRGGSGKGGAVTP